MDRKKIGGEKMKDKNLNIRIEKKLADEFERVTKEKAVNKSELLRIWIRAYVEKLRGE